MDKKLFKSILLIITYAVVLVMVLARLDVVAFAAGTVLGVFKPLIIGFCLAFILNRPCQFFFRLYNRGLNKAVARPLAVLTAYLALILLIVALFSFVLPKLVESIQIFLNSINGYMLNIQIANVVTVYTKIAMSYHKSRTKHIIFTDFLV